MRHEDLESPRYGHALADDGSLGISVQIDHERLVEDGVDDELAVLFAVALAEARCCRVPGRGASDGTA